MLYRDIATEITEGLLDHIAVLRGTASRTFEIMIQKMRDCLQQILKPAVSSLTPDFVRPGKVNFQENILKLMKNLTLLNNSQADQAMEKLVDQGQEDDVASEKSEEDVEDDAEDEDLGDLSSGKDNAAFDE